MAMTKEEFLNTLKPLLAESVVDPDGLLEAIGKRIDEIKDDGVIDTARTRKKKIKNFLRESGVPNEYMFKVCKMFMVDRMQYPPKLPTGWNGVCKKVLSRWDEFKEYCNDIDYELIDKTIP